MTDYRALHRRLRAEEREHERARARARRFGVFVWTERNRYPEAEAVRIFKREHAAEQFARAHIADNYVVRPIEGVMPNKPPKLAGDATIRRHQLAIARQTLKMSDPMAGVMGGMTKAEARAVLAEARRKPPKRRNPRAVALITEKGRTESVELTRADARNRLGYWPAAWPVGGLLRLYFRADGSLQHVYSIGRSGRDTTWHRRLTSAELAELAREALTWAAEHR